jgi:hypothetical protein
MFALYMTVCMVVSLLTIPYKHRVYAYMQICAVLANPHDDVRIKDIRKSSIAKCNPDSSAR